VFVYLWLGFVAKNLGWSPIRQQATGAGVYTFSAFQQIERTTASHQPTFSMYKSSFSLTLLTPYALSRYIRVTIERNTTEFM